MSWEGLSKGYTEMISCRSEVMTPVFQHQRQFHLSNHQDIPKECHSTSASSGTASRFLLSSKSAPSLVFELSSSTICCIVFLSSSLMPPLGPWSPPTPIPPAPMPPIPCPAPMLPFICWRWSSPTGPPPDSIACGLDTPLFACPRRLYCWLFVCCCW